MQAFKNKENILFFPVLLFGIFLSSVAVLIGFIGINQLVKSLIGKIKKINLYLHMQSFKLYFFKYD